MLICILCILNTASAEMNWQIREIIPGNESYVQQINDTEIDDEILLNVNVSGGSIDLYLRKDNDNVETERIDENSTLTYVIEESGNYELVFENNNIEEVQLDAAIEISRKDIELLATQTAENETAVSTEEAIEEEEVLEEETIPELTEVPGEESTPVTEIISQEEATSKTPGFEIPITILAVCCLIYVLRKR